MFFNCRSEEEKRRIWLWESLILGIASFFIYLIAHTPYVLIALSVLTLVYTQLNGRVSLGFWWNNLHTRWDEYQQHTDNVSKIREWQRSIEDSPWRKKTMEATQARKSSYVPGFLSNFVTKVSSLVYKKPEVGSQYEQMNDVKRRMPYTLDDMSITKSQAGQNDRFKASNHFPADSGFTQTTIPSQQTLNTHQTFNTQYGISSAYPGQKDQISIAQTSAPSFQQSPPPVTSNWFTTNDLKRRPLRNHSAYKPASVSYGGTGQSFGSRFASAFGFGGGWSNKPAGLRNEGQNLCFMNSVVQCLSRSPRLVKDLSREMTDDIDCSVAESILLSSLVELLTVCRDTSGKHKVLDPSAFLEAVSVLNSRLVAPTGERQRQQDAAEFVMWLMDTLACILNKKCYQGKSYYNVHTG